MLAATGADLQVWLFISIAAVAIVAGLAAIVIGRRRRKDEDG